MSDLRGMLEFPLDACIETADDLVLLVGEGCGFLFEKGYFHSHYLQNKVVYSSVGRSISFGSEEGVPVESVIKERMMFVFKEESLAENVYKLLCGVETTRTPLDMLIASAEEDFL